MRGRSLVRLPPPRYPRFTRVSGGAIIRGRTCDKFEVGVVSMLALRPTVFLAYIRYPPPFQSPHTLRGKKEGG